MKKLDTLDEKERAVLDLFVKLTVADPSAAFACYYASSQGSFTQALLLEHFDLQVSRPGMYPLSMLAMHGRDDVTMAWGTC